mmetsp:Transcript_4029/g.11835  ORF Transcript_4029/g.11835 Transcript_4029/m.11835 type:complete len:192 (+) Transcript_4029:40-615(+)
MGARHSAPPTHASDVVAPTDGSPSAPRRSSSETELSPPQRALSGTIYSDAAASEPPRLSLSGLSRRRSLSRGVSRLISKRLLRRRAREASEAPDEEVFEEDEEGEEEAESEGELGNDEDLDENCIVCMDQPRDATVMPCRHMVLCSRCAGALRYRTDVQHRCPICRTEIESVLEEDEQLEKAMLELPWGFR